jgi:hypothetical protein
MNRVSAGPGRCPQQIAQKAAPAEQSACHNTVYLIGWSCESLRIVFPSRSTRWRKTAFFLGLPKSAGWSRESGFQPEKCGAGH